MFFVIFASFFVTLAYGAEFTLTGECPLVKIEENFDFTKFSGLWYNVASYVSDNRKLEDCTTYDFQEDNLGYTMRVTYIDVDQEKRTQKTYLARVDPTFDAANRAQFILSYENNDKVLQFPFNILSTNYEDFAIIYTCKTLKKKIRKHYIASSLLSRSNETLSGVPLERVEAAIAKYSPIDRRSYVYQNFTEPTCSYTDKMETEFFTSHFW